MLPYRPAATALVIIATATSAWAEPAESAPLAGLEPALQAECEKRSPYEIVAAYQSSLTRTLSREAASHAKQRIATHLLDTSSWAPGFRERIWRLEPRQLTPAYFKLLRHLQERVNDQPTLLGRGVGHQIGSLWSGLDIYITMPVEVWDWDSDPRRRRQFGYRHGRIPITNAALSRCGGASAIKYFMIIHLEGKVLDKKDYGWGGFTKQKTLRREVWIARLVLKRRGSLLSGSTIWSGPAYRAKDAPLPGSIQVDMLTNRTVSYKHTAKDEAIEKAKGSVPEAKIRPLRTRFHSVRTPTGEAEIAFYDACVEVLLKRYEPGKGALAKLVSTYPQNPLLLPFLERPEKPEEPETESRPTTRSTSDPAKSSSARTRDERLRSWLSLAEQYLGIENFERCAEFCRKVLKEAPKGSPAAIKAREMLKRCAAQREDLD